MLLHNFSGAFPFALRKVNESIGAHIVVFNIGNLRVGGRVSRNGRDTREFVVGRLAGESGDACFRVGFDCVVGVTLGSGGRLRMCSLMRYLQFRKCVNGW